MISFGLTWETIFFLRSSNMSHYFFTFLYCLIVRWTYGPWRFIKLEPLRTIPTKTVCSQFRRNAPSRIKEPSYYLKYFPFRIIRFYRNLSEEFLWYSYHRAIKRMNLEDARGSKRINFRTFFIFFWWLKPLLVPKILLIDR